MGFYGCMFVLNQEQTIPELFEYHSLIQGYSGLVKTIFNRTRHRELMSTIYRNLGARFKPYYNVLPIPRETVLSADEVAEKYAAFQNSHYESDFDLETFLVEELHLDLAEDGSAYRDYIFQEENEETFEGRFDSFSVDSGAMLFIGKDGKEYSIIRVKDLDIEKMTSVLSSHQLTFMFEFVLNTEGKMIWLSGAETAAERLQAFIDYVSALDPDYTLVMTQLHD